MKKLLTIAAVITFSLAVILLLALLFYSKQQVDDVLPTELDVGFIIALLIAMSAALAAIAPLYNHMQNKQKRKPQITETEPKTPNYTPPATSDSFLQNVKTASELKHKNSQIEPRRQQNFPHLHIQTTEYGILNTAIVAIIDYGIDESSLGFLIDQIQTQYRQAEPIMPVEIVYGGNHAEDELKQIAINHRIKLIHISQYKGLLDFSQYLDKQQTRLESSTIYPPKLYVDQRLKYGNTKDKESTYETDNALQIISDWLKQDRGQFLLILGEFGTGKTFLLRELARRFHHNQQHIIPILLEMRSLEKTADLNKLLAQQLAADMPFDGDKFRYMLSQGQIILFFDGFDELALRVTYSTALEHFDTLLQAARSEKAKVVVTSRTQHFINKQQVRLKLMEHVESVKSHQITELLGFNKAQILQYLENHLGDKTKAQQRFNTIDRIKDLMGLSENPRMLSFIVRLSEAQLEQAKDAKGEITAADLYQIILDDWLNLEQKRVHTGRKDDLPLDHRWQAITELAIRLWERTEKTIHLDSLSEHITETLNHLSLDCDTTTQQIGSGTLLVRDEESRFGFIHQSVMEWLLAKHIAAAFDKANHQQLDYLLSLQAMSELMADFLCDLLEHEALAEWAKFQASGTHESLQKNARILLRRLGDRIEIGINYSNQNLQGEDFSGQDLSFANFENALLKDANFDNAVLVGVNFFSADCQFASFKSSQCQQANFKGANLIYTNFNNSDVNDANFTNADLESASLLGAAHNHTLMDASNLRLLKIFTLSFDLLKKPQYWGSTISKNPKVKPQNNLDFTGYSISHHPLLPIIITTSNKELILQNTDTGLCINILEGHEMTVMDVAFNNDGTIIASASADNTVKIWDVENGTCIKTLEGHGATVRSVSFSYDGSILASASDDGNVKVWDVKNGYCLNTLKGHRSSVSCTAFSHNDFTLLSGSSDNTLKIWDAHKGQCMNTFRGHENLVSSVGFSGDDSMLISASFDNTIKLWSRNDGQLIDSLEDHNDEVLNIAFNYNNSILASASSDNTIKLWDINSRRCINTLTGHQGSVFSVEFSQNGSLLVSGDGDGIMRFWEANTGRLVNIFMENIMATSSLSFNNNGSTIVTGFHNNSLILWDAYNGNCIGSFEGHDDWVTCLAFNSDSSIIVSGSDDNTLKLWNVYSYYCENTLIGHKSRVTSVAFSSDNSRVVSSSLDNTIKLWSVEKGECLKTFKGHLSDVTCVIFNNDDSEIVSSSDDGTLKFWDVDTGKCVNTLEAHGRALTSLTISSDGSKLASASSDSTIKLWSIGGCPINTLEGHSGIVTSLAFNNDASIIISGSYDSTLRIWDVDAGFCINVLEGHKRPVTDVAFSPDGLHLASSSGDGSIRLWRVSDGVCIAILVAFEQGWVAYTPDGRYKYGGNLQGNFWHSINLCRFEVGELDPYWHERLRLRDDEPLFTL